MEPQIRYTKTSDGVNIAYYALGHGPTLIVLPAGLGFAIEEEWKNPRLRAGAETAAQSFTYVRYDPRGSGLSDRQVEEFSLDAMVRDLESVGHALGDEPVALVGNGDSGMVAIAFAARYPERVSRLVLWASAARGLDMDNGRLRQITEMAETDWRLASEAIIQAVDNWANPETAHEVAALLRASVDAATYVRYQRAMSQWDVTELLSAISCPTLVIHPKANEYFPVELARRLATNIPGAELALLNGSSVLGPDMEFAAAAGRFLLGGDDDLFRDRPLAQPQGAAVILFTDIVSSTELTERMGDTPFRDASRTLDAGLRTAIREAGGTAIDRSLGDGVLATFPSAAQAIDAARRCLALTASSDIQPPPSNLRIRIGLHAGDVIREDNNVYGGTVNIASRICGLSAPGEILVSDVVRGMARSSAGVEFEDRGEQEMKGVGDPVRVYAVRGQRMSIEPQIQYVRTSDDVNIAYYTMGTGVPLIVPPPTVGMSVATELGIPTLRRMAEGSARVFTYIRFDVRGTGLSDRDAGELSLDAFVRDVEAVAGAAGDGLLALFASGPLSPVGILFAARYPERVSHLVLWTAYTHGGQSPAAIRESFIEMAQRDWKLATETAIRTMDQWQHSEIAGQWAAMIRESVDPATFVAFHRAVALFDVRADLPLIRAKTLVLHPKEHPYLKVEDARELAARIPGARLQLVDEPSVLMPTLEVARLAGQFILGDSIATGRQRSMPGPRRTAVILFTDIVDSTALTERLGDTRFRDASRALDAGLRAAIREAGGAAIDGKLLGDGVLATFPSAAQAIDGARRCLALSAASELGLHIGLHAGDVIREDNNVYGGAVNIASRICGLSAPGEILVSDVVRGMARSSAGVEFEDRGEQEMKGVGEPVRVYAVRGGE